MVRKQNGYNFFRVNTQTQKLSSLAEVIFGIIQPLVKYLDYYLQSPVTALPSYLCDTIDLLTYLRKLELAPDYALACKDISLLCTNSPNLHGLDAVKHFMGKSIVPEKKLSCEDDMFKQVHR